MNRVWWLLLTFALASAAVASLMLPAAGLGARYRSDPDLFATILTEVRLPRMLLALLYGAMLGGSGAAIQALFANPLASPDITGTTGGAALGAVISAYLIGFAGPLGLAAGGVTGAALALRAATAVSKAASLLRSRSTCRSRAVMTFKRRKYSPATGSIKLPMTLSLCSSGSYQTLVRKCGGSVGKKSRPRDEVV